MSPDTLHAYMYVHTRVHVPSLKMCVTCVHVCVCACVCVCVCVHDHTSAIYLGEGRLCQHIFEHNR